MYTRTDLCSNSHYRHAPCLSGVIHMLCYNSKSSSAVSLLFVVSANYVKLNVKVRHCDSLHLKPWVAVLQGKCLVDEKTEMRMARQEGYGNSNSLFLQMWWQKSISQCTTCRTLNQIGYSSWRPHWVWGIWGHSGHKLTKTDVRPVFVRQVVLSLCQMYPQISVLVRLGG